MNLALIAITVAFGWAAATGSFTLGNLLFGAILGGVGLWLVRDRVNPPRLVPRLWRILLLSGLFVRELLLSATRVGLLVIRPDMMRQLDPKIIEFPLTVTSDAEITLLANLITLTPGTLSVDVSEDRKFLHVHALRAPDEAAVIREIADGFERAIARAFR